MKKIIFLLFVSFLISCVARKGNDGIPGENEKEWKKGKDGENGRSEIQTVFKKQ